MALRDETFEKDISSTNVTLFYPKGIKQEKPFFFKDKLFENVFSFFYAMSIKKNKLYNSF